MASNLFQVQRILRGMASNVVQVQRILRGLGLYWGRIDGIAGVKTKAALKKFQAIHPPLEITGELNSETLAELFVADLPERDIESLNGYISNIPKQKDCRLFYGPIGSNQVKLDLPYSMRLAWDLSKTIKRFTCHKKVAPALANIFQDTLAFYGRKEIERLHLDRFGGCFNVRRMRGGKNYSMHSWGIAVDLDPARNQLRWGRNKAAFAGPDYDPFWTIVEGYGAVSLGRKKNYDWMHFQFARL